MRCFICIFANRAAKDLATNQGPLSVNSDLHEGICTLMRLNVSMATMKEILEYLSVITKAFFFQEVVEIGPKSSMATNLR